MPPTSQEYAEFKSMLEKALLEISFPAGIIDSEAISEGSIRPENCDLNASWTFSGNLFARNFVRKSEQNNTLRTTRPDDETEGLAVSGSDSYVSPESESTPNVNDSNSSQSKTIFLDALKKTVIYTLPSSLKNSGQMLYVKRVDTQHRNICRIETFEDDKIDSEERIMMAVQEAVVLIAASGKWHILSRYTPPQDVQNLDVSHVSNVNTKVMLLTTD